MLYSFTHVSTVTGCDELITQAQRESDIITSRRNNLMAAVNHHQTSLAIAQEDLDAANAEIAALEALIPGLPEGIEKKDKKQDMYELMASREGLEKRLMSPISDKQVTLGRYEHLLNWTSEWIAALEARKLELQNA